MTYTIIGTLSLIVFGILYYEKRKRTAFKELLATPLSELQEWQKEQNEINCNFIAEIINGHYDHGISNRTKNKSIKRFGKWQEKMNFLTSIATPERIALLNSYIEMNDKHIFKFQYVRESPCLPNKKRPEGWQLFCKNGFTDPFPSLYDMSEGAVATQLTQFFVLNGITPDTSHRFVFHEKFHYVNHKMTQAIIQFDLYKMPV